MTILLAALFLLNLFVGSVDIPVADVLAILAGGGDAGSPANFIVLGSRVPQAVTSLLAGAGLTLSGLMLQTAFRNPLAGPSVLGINSGASLGVAIVVLFLGSSVSAAGFSWGGYVAVLIGAFAGSAAIMGLLLLFSVWLKNDLMLLITGIMIGYLASSVIMLLNYVSSAEGVHGYVMWGMGNFSGVSLDQLPVFAALALFGILLTVLLIKPLNLLQLGDNYARNLGLSINAVRNLLLVATGVLSSVVTAFCGPVSFIGLAVPHIAKMIYRTADHRVLVPGCILTGGVVGLLCNLLCVLPGDFILPLNGVTPLIGVPVILYVILRPGIAPISERRPKAPLKINPPKRRRYIVLCPGSIPGVQSPKISLQISRLCIFKQHLIERYRTQMPQFCVFLLECAIGGGFIDASQSLGDGYPEIFSIHHGHSAHLARQDEIQVFVGDFSCHFLTSFASTKEIAGSDFSV